MFCVEKKEDMSSEPCGEAEDGLRTGDKPEMPSSGDVSLLAALARLSRVLSFCLAFSALGLLRHPSPTLLSYISDTNGSYIDVAAASRTPHSSALQYPNSLTYKYPETMGCLPSKPTFASAKATTSMSTQQLQPLVRPARYQGGKRPSFTAAYARAARRYGFEPGRNAGFAKRNNVVVKVKSKHDKDTEHEVPAESIQNGAPICRFPSCPPLTLPVIVTLALV